MKSLVFPSSAAGVPETHHTTTDSPHAGKSGNLFPGSAPAELVELVHDQPMTTSRRVAAMFRKEHKNVLRSLEKLLPALKADDFDRLNFEPITYTEAHHYANEARLIGYAMTGVCIGVDRSTLDADTLRLLHRVETLNIKLLIRGADRDTRKTELRALVLKAQATAQALDAGDADPLPSIGGAA